MSAQRTVSFGVYDAKHPGETIAIEFEWFSLLATLWEPGKQQALNAYVNSLLAPGFAYQVTTAGRSGLYEPAWPQTLGATVVDGSITWTTVAGGANGVQAASAPVVTDPSGELTITSVAVQNGRGTNTRVRCVVAGGFAGKRYRLVCQITAGAQTLVGTLLLPVSAEV